MWISCFVAHALNKRPSSDDDTNSYFLQFQTVYQIVTLLEKWPTQRNKMWVEVYKKKLFRIQNGIFLNYFCSFSWSIVFNSVLLCHPKQLDVETLYQKKQINIHILYVFTQPLLHGQYVAQGQFLSSCFCLVIWFHGISTLDGYLMPNLVYTYDFQVNAL